MGVAGRGRGKGSVPVLESVTRGRGIPKERLAEVARHYEAIGGKSPINAITNRQAEGVRKLLSESVYVGHRNWHPFLEDTLRTMATDGVQHAVGFVTSAYRCEASWDRYLKTVEEARGKIGETAPVIQYVDPWYDHPLFIEAICERIKSVAGDDAKQWIFTA